MKNSFVTKLLRMETAETLKGCPIFLDVSDTMLFSWSFWSNLLKKNVGEC